MSAQSGHQEQEDLDNLMVFDGSSPEDVSHAKQLWSSLSLMPPLESRLVSAHIRQRLPVSRPQRRSAAPDPPKSTTEPPSACAVQQREEERQRYMDMADQRKEILARLRRQREQRIEKELISAPFQPRAKFTPEPKVKPPKLSDTDTDGNEELVRQLQ